MLKVLEPKNIDPKIPQTEIKKSMGISDSLIKRYRNDMSMDGF